MEKTMVLEALTAGLVFITGVYVIATFRILRANQEAVAVMRQQTEAVSRPYVTIAPLIPEKRHLFYAARCSRTG